MPDLVGLGIALIVVLCVIAAYQAKRKKQTREIIAAEAARREQLVRDLERVLSPPPEPRPAAPIAAPMPIAMQPHATARRIVLPDPPRIEPDPIVTRMLDDAENAKRVVAIDVETTGFGPYARMVSFGAIVCEKEPIDAETRYLVFDPGRDCDPDAIRIHGFDDWTLRHQEVFSAHAVALRELLLGAGLVVAHNADFDLDMLRREFKRAGLDPVAPKTFCTMMVARARWPDAPSSLDACLERTGVGSRQAKRHGAVEDAYLALGLFMFLSGRGGEHRLGVPSRPTNLKETPPRPEGILPRRTPKRRKLTREQGSAPANPALR